MRALLAVIAVLGSAAAFGQAQQPKSQPGWPCVAGRPVDPSYVEIAESTGGHLFMFQKDEIALSTSFLSVSQTHPATIFRAVGFSAGAKEWTFPVDSTVRSLYVAVSMQCRQSIAVLDPTGAEMTQANAILAQELKTGKLVRVDLPGAGQWRVRVSGQGLTVVLVMAATDLRLGDIRLPKDEEFHPGTPLRLAAHVSGEIHDARFSLIGAAGERLAGTVPAEQSEGTFALEVTPPTERFRIMLEGLDALGNPVQRVNPVLFRAN